MARSAASNRREPRRFDQDELGEAAHIELDRAAYLTLGDDEIAYLIDDWAKIVAALRERLGPAAEYLRSHPRHSKGRRHAVCRAPDSSHGMPLFLCGGGEWLRRGRHLGRGGKPS